MTYYILIPLYNEAANIELLATTLKNILPDKEKFFVFADDRSSDNTVQLLQKYFSDSSYEILLKEQNAGPGDSFNIGFEWILTHSSNSQDKVITMEADNTSDPNILPHMTSLAEMGYSLVLASIYAQSGGFHKTSLFRKLISFAANMFFRSFFNIKVLTLSSFYRVYHIELLQKIKKNNDIIIKEKGFICMLEVLLKAIKANASIIEVPMTLRSDNRVGKSKMNVFKTSLSYIRFFMKKH